MRILVPLDGSQLAEQALVSAGRIARLSHDATTLILFRVVRFPVIDTYYAGGFSGAGNDQIYQEMLDESRDYLRVLKQRPNLAGIDLQSEVTEGFAPDAIVAAAERHHSDLILMTTHGRSGFAKLTWGSVAETVARNASTPTLVIHSSDTPFPNRDETETYTILIPLDGTPFAEAAVDPAIRLAHQLGGVIRLLSVLPRQPARNDEVWKQSDVAFEYLTKVLERVESQGVTAFRTLAYGDPAEQIAAEAAEYKVDVIAIATHGRAGFELLVKGSISESVLEHVTVPVLIIHHKA